MLRSVFAFWDAADQSILHELTRAWRAAIPGFQVFGNNDVVPLLSDFCPEHVGLYEAIRIPAARADIARLLLLHRFGGLYVDCHCGDIDADGTRRLLAMLETFEAVFIDKVVPPEVAADGCLRFMNSVILCRAGSDIPLAICRRALANLAAQWEAERRGGLFFPYHIGAMCGPRLVTSVILADDQRSGIRDLYRARVASMHERDLPFRRNIHRGYSVPGQHWSERQKHEPLFHCDGSSEIAPARAHQ